MPDYSELPDIIGKMKRAAIDCFMADQGFHPNWGNDQIYAKWGFMLNFYNRPNAAGEGGGDGNGVNHSVAPAFDEIRAAIDSRVSKWLDLPDGGDACDAPASATSAAAAILGTSGAGASVQNTGAIGTANDSVHEMMANKIEGSFKPAFIDKYYIQFKSVTHGLGDACVILQLNYSAQAAMWPAARQDVVSICDSARAAWDQKAGNAAAANGTLVLTVVGAVAGVVSAVVTAGTGTVAAAAVLAGIAGAVSSGVQGIARDVVISGNTYLDILESLDEALTKLDEALEAQENKLNDAMTEAASIIRSDNATYNLDAFALGPYPVGDGTMSMDRSNATVVSNSMGRIDTELASAAATLGSAPGANPTPRNAGVGRSSNGTHYAASDLYALTARCLALTVAEYARGHQLFDATVEDYFSSDAAASQEVSRLLAEEILSANLGV
ncbi:MULTISPECIES: hypothetical protein [unclassified Microbacterium]|uniref:hypothetical protein n=1 Tax=unclassified Microbacterium TaxID=2609290 RepID=UPI003467E99C